MSRSPALISRRSAADWFGVLEPMGHTKNPQLVKTARKGKKTTPWRCLHAQVVQDNVILHVRNFLLALRRPRSVVQGEIACCCPSMVPPVGSFADSSPTDVTPATRTPPPKMWIGLPGAIDPPVLGIRFVAPSSRPLGALDLPRTEERRKGEEHPTIARMQTDRRARVNSVWVGSLV